MFDFSKKKNKIEFYFHFSKIKHFPTFKGDLFARFIPFDGVIHPALL